MFISENFILKFSLKKIMSRNKAVSHLQKREAFPRMCPPAVKLLLPLEFKTRAHFRLNWKAWSGSAEPIINAISLGFVVFGSSAYEHHKSIHLKFLLQKNLHQNLNA